MSNNFRYPVGLKIKDLETDAFNKNWIKQKMKYVIYINVYTNIEDKNVG